MAATGTETLPEGWTRHTLSGNTFFYHQRNNVWQRDMPVSHTAAQPIAVSQSVVDWQPPRATTSGLFEMQPVEVSPVVTQPGSSSANISDASSNVAVAAEVVASAPPSVTPSQQMKQLKVIVPAPGVAPGQLLAFTTPAEQGQQPQQMAVAVADGAVQGSTVVVQYPCPNTHSAPDRQHLQVPLLPELSVCAQEADRRASFTAWCLYGLGWCCLCFFGPFTACLWTLSAALYYCKPQAQREQRPRQRKAAKAALYTCLGGSCLGLLGMACVLAGCAAGADCGPNSPGHHHHFGWHHHHPHWMAHFQPHEFHSDHTRPYHTSHNDDGSRNDEYEMLRQRKHRGNPDTWTGLRASPLQSTSEEVPSTGSVV